MLSQQNISLDRLGGILGELEERVFPGEDDFRQFIFPNLIHKGSRKTTTIKPSLDADNSFAIKIAQSDVQYVLERFPIFDTSVTGILNDIHQLLRNATRTPVVAPGFSTREYEQARLSDLLKEKSGECSVVACCAKILLENYLPDIPSYLALGGIFPENDSPGGHCFVLAADQPTRWFISDPTRDHSPESVISCRFNSVNEEYTLSVQGSNDIYTILKGK